MNAPSRATLTVLAALLAGCAGAALSNPADAIRADRWDAARTEAAADADPVAGKVVAFYRMLAPGAAGYAEIAAFQRDNPLWPSQPLLERRRQEALARETDPDALSAGCATALTQPAALLRCAEAERDPARAAAFARAAWPGVTDPAAETAFLRRWGDALAPLDNWKKFDALAWAGSPAAAAQIARLSGDERPVADARLGLKRDDPKALALAEALGKRIDPALFPGLFLEHARYLRRAGREPDALALWTAQGLSNEAAASDHAAEFWTERNALARKLLTAGDVAGAYAVVATHGELAAEQQADADFLAGFIALRLLSDPARAAPHFQSLARSPSAITQGRAHHWLALTAQAAGQDPGPELRQSASWPLTYYGQLSARALGEAPEALAARIAAARDPAWTRAQAESLDAEETTRAALLLAGWGDRRRAATFLIQAADASPDPARRAALADLAGSLDLPQAAVAIARRMGRDGQVLPRAGWPRPFDPPSPPDAAFSLGIMRQESSFDAAALSPSGARGLMQLMPATAKAVATSAGVAGSSDDPAVNTRLGTSYLQSLLDQFGDPALAAAAYNAGPHRVREWLAANGDPRAGPVTMEDWIELIPFNETRNYVQRVLENATVYRAR